jgi:hypothetical protein
MIAKLVAINPLVSLAVTLMLNLYKGPAIGSPERPVWLEARINELNAARRSADEDLSREARLEIIVLMAELSVYRGQATPDEAFAFLNEEDVPTTRTQESSTTDISDLADQLLRSIAYADQDQLENVCEALAYLSDLTPEEVLQALHEISERYVWRK